MPQLYTPDGQPTGCKGPRWYLRKIDEIQAQLDGNEPERAFFCRYCQVHHMVKADRLVAAGDTQEARRRKAAQLASPDWCQLHRRRTTSPRLTAPCSYCPAELHIHLDQLDAARKGEVTQECPGCHKATAIRVNVDVEAWKLKGKPEASGVIRALRLDSGKVAWQLELVK